MVNYRTQKIWLKNYCKAHGVPKRKGFYAYSDKWGKPAQRLWSTVLFSRGMRITDSPTPANIGVIKPFRVKLIDRARRELGTKEWPPGSNWGDVQKYLAAVGFRFPTPWCAAFVTYCVRKAGWRRAIPPLPGWVPSWESWGKKHGYERAKLTARKGDIVTFNWDKDPAGEHIGLILRNYGPYKQVATIEGNATSTAIPGGGVVKKRRYWYQVNHVYRLPNY